MSTAPSLMLDVDAAAAQVRAHVANPRERLPTPVFHLVSELTPLVNVDLLIQDEGGRTLLTWRADAFYGPGWHVPGGIVRFKETFATRIALVAHTELGCTVTAGAAPLSLREVMSPSRDVRGHFISLLYACRLTSMPAVHLAAGSGPRESGQWQWHTQCPDDLISAHDMYRPYIQRPQALIHG
jgi:ADP-ribose pyrophosphatase YjhB (NUDIX family)